MQDPKDQPPENPDRSRLALLGALSAGAAGGACRSFEIDGEAFGDAEPRRSTGPQADPRFEPSDTSGGDSGGGGGGSH
jgi:hypothetical protein